MFYEYVTNVIDGDTFDTKNRLARLADVNAPELDEMGGLEAKRHLERIIGDK